MSRYIVTLAPGHYGDSTSVILATDDWHTALVCAHRSPGRRAVYAGHPDLTEGSTIWADMAQHWARLDRRPGDAPRWAARYAPNSQIGLWSVDVLPPARAAQANLYDMERDGVYVSSHATRAAAEQAIQRYAREWLSQPTSI